MNEFDTNDKREYYRKEYLKSEHWKILKASKLSESPKCERCNARKNLDVHHLQYKNLYDVETKDLQTLCRKCHHEVHKEEPKLTEKELIQQFIVRSKMRKKYRGGINVNSEKYQRFLEKCRLEKSRHYHKTNESDCQSEENGGIPL